MVVSVSIQFIIRLRTMW